MKKILLILIPLSISYSQENEKSVINNLQTKINLYDDKTITINKDDILDNSLLNYLVNRKSLLNTFKFYQGINTSLEENGFSNEINYKIDFFSNLKGGIKNSSNYVDNLDIAFNLDFEKLLNWNDGSFKVHFIGNSGGSICSLVNASQGITNIESYPTWKLYQFVLEKNLTDNLNLALGLYDLNTEFDTRETSSIFINPSHGVGDELAKSGVNGPSIFPNTSLGIRFKYKFDENKILSMALLDGVPGNPENPKGTQIILNKNDGIFSILQYQILNDKFNILLGTWIYSSKTEKFLSSNQLENNFGFYFSAEKLNFINNYNGFFRIGVANSSTNPSDFYIGAGVKINDFYTKLNIEEIGIATAITHNSDDFFTKLQNDNIYIKKYEVNIEFTFTIKITEWMQIQPDFQYIINPIYCNLNEMAFVSGVRLSLKI